MSQYDDRKYDSVECKEMILMFIQRIRAINESTDLSEEAKSKLISRQIIGLESGFQNKYYSCYYSAYLDQISKVILDFNTEQLDFKYILKE